jgi:hypothetical protein
VGVDDGGEGERRMSEQCDCHFSESRPVRSVGFGRACVDPRRASLSARLLMTECVGACLPRQTSQHHSDARSTLSGPLSDVREPVSKPQCKGLKQGEELLDLVC